MDITLDIREASVEDAGEILTLQRAAYVAEAQRYRDPHLPPLTESLEEVRAALADETRVIAARMGHRLVGSARVETGAGTGHVGRLAVVPDLQGRGIGGRLLVAIEAACSPPVSRFELFTGASSEANLRFYQKHGYVVFDHRRDPGGNPLAYLEKVVGAPATP